MLKLDLLFRSENDPNPTRLGKDQRHPFKKRQANRGSRPVHPPNIATRFRDREKVRRFGAYGLVVSNWKNLSGGAMNSMNKTQYAAFLSRVQQAVEYRLKHPEKSRAEIGKKFGVSKDTITKYAAKWHPSRFSVTQRPEVVRQSPRPPRLRRGLFARLGERWVLPENYPSELRFSELKVLEYYE